MKFKAFIFWAISFFILTANAQFVNKPLNFTENDINVVTYSIIDQNHAWFGVDQVYWSPMSWNSFPWFVHTHDGGNSWQYDSIPWTGKIAVQEVSSVDSNTCYYAVTDNDIVFKVWKTTNRGLTWQDKATPQFITNFMCFLKAYSADTILTIGIPYQGYWLIQRSTDGGDTWTRVPSASIAPALAGEYSNWQYHSEIGDTIWFGTTRGRCYRSVDRGLNWTMTSPIGGSAGDDCNVKFVNAQNGVFYRPGSAASVRRSFDGGTTWSAISLPNNMIPFSVSPVPGFAQGFIFTVPTATPKVYDLYFTPDLFSSVILITPGLSTYGFLSFKDATTGWVSGAGTTTNNIWKYNSILTAIQEAGEDQTSFNIIPNPSNGYSLLSLPLGNSSMPGIIRVFTLTGNLIETITSSPSDHWRSLDGKNYRNGIYLVEYSCSDGQKHHKRWIVQH